MASRPASIWESRRRSASAILIPSSDDGSSEQPANRGWELVEYPPEKAATDGELALNEALARGATRIRILGALTGIDRFDHGVANLFLLARDDLAGVDIRLIDEMREAFIVRQMVNPPPSPASEATT